MRINFKTVGITRSPDSGILTQTAYLIELLSQVSDDQYIDDSSKFCGTHSYAFPAPKEIAEWVQKNELRRQLLIRDLIIFIGPTSSGLVKGFACSRTLFSHSKCLIQRFKSAAEPTGSGLGLVHTDLDIDAIKIIDRALRNPTDVSSKDVSTSTASIALVKTYQTLNFSNNLFDEFLFNILKGDHVKLHQIAFVSTVITNLKPPDSTHLTRTTERLYEFIPYLNARLGRAFKSQNTSDKKTVAATASLFLQALYEQKAIKNPDFWHYRESKNLVTLDSEVASHYVKLMLVTKYKDSSNIPCTSNVGFLDDVVLASTRVDGRIIASAIACLAIHENVLNSLKRYDPLTRGRWSEAKDGDRFHNLINRFIDELVSPASIQISQGVVSLTPVAAKCVVDIAMLNDEDGQRWSAFMLTTLTINEHNLDAEIFGNWETVTALGALPSRKKITELTKRIEELIIQRAKDERENGHGYVNGCVNGCVIC